LSVCEELVGVNNTGGSETDLEMSISV
jgi:hypothetical protein